MNKISEKEWLRDFQDFVAESSEEVAPGMSEALLTRVRKDLQPSAWSVFVKLLSLHLVVGTLSLAVCNQFDLNPFRSGFSLSNYFMSFGHSFCMFMCGLFFLSSSLFVSRFLLRPEEFHVVRRNTGLQSLGLCMVSLGLFAMLGAELALSWVLLWISGALLGSFLTNLSLYRPIQLKT